MSWWSKSATPIPTTPDGFAEAMAAKHETRRMQFAMLIYATFVGLVGLVCVYPVQLKDGPMGIIIGGLISNASIVIGYYFTTSMGASAAALRSKAPTVTTTTAPTPDAATPTTTTTVGPVVEPPAAAAPVEPPKDRP
jgi:hypothetical protein